MKNKPLTRGQTSAFGKPKVFYYADRSDGNNYLEKIAGYILNYENCAIYYASEEDNSEELLEDIELMDLIAVPVTANFIQGYRKDEDNAFNIALKKNIPILPILMENGLEADFNQKCGNLQILVDDPADKTALSFEEKLSVFLKETLVGDELAKKIRAAFDAYIFLSYRKKDRKYANQLMRLIHSDERFNSVAVWYDERLVPGKDFNSDIENMMLKSDVFALSVTPNLLEIYEDGKKNYVMAVEYPKAHDVFKKPVLAVEMEKTDHAALKANYSGIPEPVDPNNSTKLGEKLGSCIGEKLRPHNNDPEHDFLMGISFLKGVDVEKNVVNAEKLITSAAEKGLPDAVLKLSHMYMYGDGVTRDYEKAISWRRKFVNIVRERYEKSGSTELTLAYSEALTGFSDMLEELHEYEQAYDAYSETVEFAASLPDSPAAHRKRIIAARNMCMLLFKLERYDEAEKRLRDLISVIENGNESVLSVNCLADSYDCLGDIAYKRGKSSEALENYTKELEITETKLQEIDPEFYRFNYPVILSKLGNVSRQTGDSKKAVGYFRRDVELMESVADEEKSVEAYRSLLKAHLSLAESLEDLGNLDEALQEEKKALYIAENIEHSSGMPEDIRNTGVANIRLTKTYMRKSKYHKAKKHLEQTLERDKRLLESFHDAATQDDYLTALTCMGELLLAQGFEGEAYDFFSKALEQIDELPAGDLNRLQKKEALHYYIGRYLKKYGDPLSDIDSLCAAVNYCEKIHKLCPTTQSIRLLTMRCFDLGEVLYRCGDTDGAVSCFMRSVAIDNENSTIFPGLSKLALARISEKNGRIEETNRYIDDALCAFAEQAKKNPATTTVYSAITDMINGRKLLESDTENAISMIGIGYTFLQQSEKLYRTDKFAMFLGNASFDLMNACSGDNALTFGDQCFEYRRKLMNETSSAYAYKNYLDTVNVLILLYMEAKYYREAHLFCDKFYRIAGVAKQKGLIDIEPKIIIPVSEQLKGLVEKTSEELAVLARIAHDTGIEFDRLPDPENEREWNLFLDYADHLRMTGDYRSAVNVYRLLGTSFRRAGYFSGAEAFFTNAKRCAEYLYRWEKTPANKSVVLNMKEELAGVYHDTKEFDISLGFAYDCLRQRFEINEMSEDGELPLLHTLELTAQIERDCGKNEEAAEHYALLAERYDMLLAEEASEDELRALISIYSEAGEMYNKSDDYESAYDMYSAGASKAEELYQDIGDTESGNSLIQMLYRSACMTENSSIAGKLIAEAIDVGDELDAVGLANETTKWLVDLAEKF